MVNIGELLGRGEIANLFSEAVEEGEVYRLRLSSAEGVVAKKKGDDGRKKYFIVIGKDQEGNAIGFVLINSEVNPHLPACRKVLHYLLKATDYEFLEGEDLFVDCSDFKKISKERFADLFSAEKQKRKINQQDVKIIKDLICSYENVSMKMLRRFGLM